MFAWPHLVESRLGLAADGLHRRLRRCHVRQRHSLMSVAIALMSLSGCASQSAPPAKPQPQPPAPSSSDTKSASDPADRAAQPAGVEEAGSSPSGATETARSEAEVATREDGTKPSQSTSEDTPSLVAEASPEAEGEASRDPSPSLEAASATGPGTSQKTPGVSGPRTAGEREAILDGELDESLAEFDGMLLKEQEVAAKKRESAAIGSSTGFGGTSDSDSFFDDETGEENRGESTDSAGDTGHAADDAGEGAEPGVEAGKRTPGGGSGGRVPPDVGDGSDDDIIARQLREAAFQLG